MEQESPEMQEMRSEGRSDERPALIKIGNRVFRVRRLLESVIEEDSISGTRQRKFHCELENGLSVWVRKPV